MLVIILSSPGSHLSLSLLLYSLFLVLLVYFLLSGRQNIFHCGKSDCDTVLWIISLGSMLWFSVLFISGYFARLNYSGFGNQMEFDSCHAKKKCCAYLLWFTRFGWNVRNRKSHRPTWLTDAIAADRHTSVWDKVSPPKMLFGFFPRSFLNFDAPIEFCCCCRFVCCFIIYFF